MEEYSFWQLSYIGIRDKLTLKVVRKIEVPLEYQEDYGVYALYTSPKIEGRKVSAQLMAAALKEWQQRYPEGSSSNHFWAQLMDTWVAQRLPFLPEDKRRSVSVQLERLCFASFDGAEECEFIWVTFGDGSVRRGQSRDVPNRPPSTKSSFKAALREGDIVQTEGKTTGNWTREVWLLAVAERLPRK